MEKVLVNTNQTSLNPMGLQRFIRVAMTTFQAHHQIGSMSS